MTDRPPPREGHESSPFDWLWTVGFGALGVSSGYATIQWLKSSEPLGALAPAPFLVLSLWWLILSLKYGGQGATFHSNFMWNLVAIVIVVDLVILYSAAYSTGKNVYSHQGTSLAIFGGIVVILALVGCLPRVRERRRIAGEEHDREVRQSTGEL